MSISMQEFNNVRINVEGLTNEQRVALMRKLIELNEGHSENADYARHAVLLYPCASHGAAGYDNSRYPNSLKRYPLEIDGQEFIDKVLGGKL